jgi:hypothetical protein
MMQTGQLGTSLYSQFDYSSELLFGDPSSPVTEQNPDQHQRKFAGGVKHGEDNEVW